MKEIIIKKTGLSIANLKGIMNSPIEAKKIDYLGIMEIALDLPPQGGFTPKDIKDRNRIQEAINKTKESKAKDIKLKLEDSDYENLVNIIKTSRWGTRDKELAAFLDNF